MTGLFDKFKEDDSEGSEMVEERQAYEENEPETTPVSYTHLTLPTKA